MPPSPDPISTAARVQPEGSPRLCPAIRGKIRVPTTFCSTTMKIRNNSAMLGASVRIIRVPRIAPI